MTYYNLGSGGDPTNNGDYSLYPQNLHLAGKNQAHGTLLKPAEHMSPSTYNIWRNLNFKEQANSSKLALDDFLQCLTDNGTPLVKDDIIGAVTLPHRAVVQGVYWEIECPQENTVLQLVRCVDGEWEDIGDQIDASEVSCGFIEGWMVPCINNDQVGMRLVSWPEADTTEVDPCGVFGPCDEYTLCITLNAFIWYPAAEHFCNVAPCFGVKGLPQRQTLESEKEEAAEEKAATTEDSPETNEKAATTEDSLETNEKAATTE